MALVNCPECKTEVSDKAKACPKCGIPLNRVSVKRVGKLFLKVVGGIFIALIVLVIIGVIWDKFDKAKMMENEKLVGVPFEELGQDSTNNENHFMCVYIYTPVADPSLLFKVIGVYKKHFSTLKNGFQLFFYNNRSKAPHNTKEDFSNEARSCFQARYLLNNITGKNVLELYENGDFIREIKLKE